MGGEQTVTRREKGLSFLVLAAAALAMVALCSMSSPLYPINIWGDANCLMTVGRAMKAGAVVYRDIYEQKGPTLYLAHMLAACISDSSFFIRSFKKYQGVTPRQRLEEEIGNRD